MENMMEHRSLSLFVECGSSLKGGNVLLERNAPLGGGRELLPEDFRLPSVIPYCQIYQKAFGKTRRKYVKVSTEVLARQWEYRSFFFFFSKVRGFLMKKRIISKI